MPTAYPGLHGTDPEVGGHDAAAAARRRVQHDRGGQVAPRARRASVRTRDRSTGGRSASASSATTGSSRATRTSGARTSSATTSTSTRRPRPKTATTSPRTSPTPRSATSRTRSTRHPIARSSSTSHSARCTRRITSRRSGSSRTAVASTADGSAGARRCSRARSRLGIVPEGTVLSERPPWVQDWDALQRRRAPAVYARFQEVFAGFLTHTDAQIGRVVIVPRGDRRARQHARDARVRQRHQRRRRPHRDVQRAPLHAGAARDHRGEPRAPRRVRRLPLLQPLPVGLGVGGQHAAAAVEALHVAGRHPHAADRALARRLRRARRGARAVRARDRPHAHGARRVRRRRARHRSTASRNSRSTAPASRATFDDAGAPSPRAVQYFEMLGFTLDRLRRLEGDHRPRVAGRRRRGAAARGEPRLRRPTSGRCSTSTTTSPRPPTSPTSIPTCWRGSQERLARRSRRATRCSRSSTASSRASPPRCPPPESRRVALRVTGRRAARCPTTRCRACSAGSASPPRSTCRRRPGRRALRDGRLDERVRVLRARRHSSCSRSTAPATCAWCADPRPCPPVRHRLVVPLRRRRRQRPGGHAAARRRRGRVGHARRGGADVLAARRHRALPRPRPRLPGVRRLRGPVRVERRAPRGDRGSRPPDAARPGRRSCGSRSPAVTASERWSSCAELRAGRWGGPCRSRSRCARG